MGHKGFIYLFILCLSFPVETQAFIHSFQTCCVCTVAKPWIDFYVTVMFMVFFPFLECLIYSVLYALIYLFSSLLQGEILLVYIKMEDPNDFVTWLQVAKVNEVMLC